ncbi:hypothetical protein [Burkholderia sp. F1]|uniref:hypothetical protein n=1 Tax=Burkholderia sp. F1 TaxID=3366817 RepID=UPI003D7411F7
MTINLATPELRTFEREPKRGCRDVAAREACNRMRRSEPGRNGQQAISENEKRVRAAGRVIRMACPGN